MATAANAKPPRAAPRNVAADWLISLATSRAITVVSIGCAAVYSLLLVLALLQNRGIIDSRLPIPVMNSAIVRRSHAELRPEAVTPQDVAGRSQLLANVQTATKAETAPVSPLTLEVEATPPVKVWMLDSSGAQIGMNPYIGPIMAIDDASYSGASSLQQFVSIRHAQGPYRILLVGTESGDYVLRVRLIANDDLEHAIQYGGGGHVFRDTLLQVTVSTGLADGQPQLNLSNIEVVTAGEMPAAAEPAGIDASQSSTQMNPGAATQDPEEVVRLRPPAKLPLPLPGVDSSTDYVLAPASSGSPSPLGAAGESGMSSASGTQSSSASGSNGSLAASQSAGPSVSPSDNPSNQPTQSSGDASSTPLPAVPTSQTSPTAMPGSVLSSTATPLPPTWTATLIPSVSPSPQDSPTTAPTNTATTESIGPTLTPVPADATSTATQTSIASSTPTVAPTQVSTVVSTPTRAPTATFTPGASRTPSATSLPSATATHPGGGAMPTLTKTTGNGNSTTG